MADSRKILFLIIIVSMVLFLTAISVAVLFPSIYEQKLEEETNLVENSILYDMWKDLPLPIYQRMYFFNITNAQQFMKFGGILEVEEVGPYSYKSHWVKESIERHPNGTISYREVKTFVFEREESVGSQDDFIYTLNGPLLLAADFLKDNGPLLRKAADKVLRFIHEQLVVKAKVRELAFDGYADPIIGFSKFFRPETPFRDSKFCWLYGRNATDDGIFNVFTGEQNREQLSIIDKYNGSQYLTFWKDEPCNRVNGSNAEFGPPLRDNQDTYTFFQPIFCRSMTFNYSGVQIHKMMTSKRFENTYETFSKWNPDNYCFEIDPELDSGVLDVSPCQFQAPVVLSFPHFYLADSSFLANIDGLDPDEAKHGSHIDVEPLTGATVDLSIKFQLNIKVPRDEYLSMLNYVEPGVYPIFWIDISATMPDDLASTLRNNLYLPRTIAFASVTCLILVSAVMFITAVWSLLKLKTGKELVFECEESEKKPLLLKVHGVHVPNKSGASNETLATETVMSLNQDTNMSK